MGENAKLDSIVSSSQPNSSRLIFLNDQIQNNSEAIELSTQEFKRVDHSPVYLFRYEDVVIYARYRINLDHKNKNGFRDKKEVESFKFFLTFIIKSVTKFNKRMEMLTEYAGNPEADKELNQSSGPKWIFCSYPFIWIVNYDRESHTYQPHSIVNIERQRTEYGAKHDIYDDIINAYLLVHPGCERYDCDYANLKVANTNCTVSHDDGEHMHVSSPVIQITRDGKNLPFLPMYENRCLWCGGKIEKIDSSGNSVKTRRPRYYCCNNCKMKDQDYSKVFENRLLAADSRRILPLYRKYLKNNGRWGKSMTSKERENQTEDNIITDYLMGTIPHIQIMSWIRGPCKECGKEIPLNKSINARYCSRECSDKGRKREWWHNHHQKSDSA